MPSAPFIQMSSRVVPPRGVHADLRQVADSSGVGSPDIWWWWSVEGTKQTVSYQLPPQSELMRPGDEIYFSRQMRVICSTRAICQSRAPGLGSRHDGNCALLNNLLICVVGDQCGCRQPGAALLFVIIYLFIHFSKVHLDAGVPPRDVFDLSAAPRDVTACKSDQARMTHARADGRWRGGGHATETTERCKTRISEIARTWRSDCSSSRSSPHTVCPLSGDAPPSLLLPPLLLLIRQTSAKGHTQIHAAKVRRGCVLRYLHGGG